MNADFFFRFTKFKFGSLVNAEDFADKVNYQWTGAFLIISTAVIAMRQYIFTPIQCWVPPEWPRPWEEYTENYCWIQNTYHVAHMDPAHPDMLTRRKSELNYYQWVPFVLALEALLVYTPHLVWKIMAQQIGYNPNAIVKFAAETATMDQERKKKLVNFLARHIEKTINCRGCGHYQDSRTGPDCGRQVTFKTEPRQKLHQACHKFLPCFWFGKRSGTMLLALYITNKMVYALVGVAHLFIMQSFLGFDSLAFGWHCMSNLLRGREWEQTMVFPRVTFCDVPSKHVGQWNIRSVQCVLPVNLLNEKIYIFLWFWTILCLSLTGGSTIVWLIRLLVYKNRQTFVKRYLMVLRSACDESKEDKKKRKQFVNQFLSHDGIFLLRMIAENIGDVCAAEIVEELYKLYRGGDAEEAVASNALPNGARRSSANFLRRTSQMNPPVDFFGKKSVV
uniref:Innexin n=1 Tax=Macrostomum lignano TaxID=282301 RepID=A0A1I8I560_9PLAT